VPADNEDARELYGAFALIVFLPWRSRDDLRSRSDASWWEAYEASELPPYAVAKLGTFQAWHDGGDKKRRVPPASDVEGAQNGAPRDAAVDSGVGGSGGSSDEEGGGSDGGISIDPEAALGADVDNGDGVGSAPLDFVAGLAIDDGGFEMLPQRRLVCMRAESRGLVNAVAHVHTGGAAALCGRAAELDAPLEPIDGDGSAEPLLERAATAARRAIVGGSGPSATKLDAALQAACEARRTCDGDAMRVAASLDGTEGEGAPFNANPLPEVTVERLDALEEDAQGLLRGGTEVAAATRAEAAGLTPRSSPPPGLSAAVIAEVFTLNTEQRRAFGQCAKALAGQWAKRLHALAEVDTGLPPSPAVRRGVADVVDDTPADGQLLMYLGGTAGAGTSRVIDAVRVCALSWARARSVVCAALTGVAAANIDGSTIQSLLKLALSEKQKKVTLSLVRFFTGVVIVIIDELSMISADFLALIEKRLRQVGEPGVIVGGQSVVLCGDLKQLPPVLSTLLWTAGSPPKAGNAAEDERHVRRLRGVQVWRCFQTVIFLQRNMRQGADPVFATLCNRMRDGLMTPADVNTINTNYVVSRETPPKLSVADVDLFCPIIVGTNAARVQVTKSILRRCARQLRAE